jgi:hypothetical protein
MTEIEPLYPPAPKDVPADLAKPGFRYRMMVVLVSLNGILKQQENLASACLAQP